jgi:DNA-binding NtrC family response regulator
MSPSVPHFIGRSEAFQHVLALIERVARYQVPVLIHGETGTGKEMAARAVHYLSARRAAPFVPVNCGALPEALTESELFGCERGAYTDARERRAGLVSAAEGGTLFLDEVDALAPRAQVSLLRFLQDHSYRPVGSTRERCGDVRVIAAASPRLRGLIEAGAFRDDLAFRLSVLVIDMPALRARPGDPALLARHFVERHARAHGMAARGLHPTSLDWIERYDWPGNVRELDNLVQSALLLSDDAELCLQPTLGLPGAASAHRWPAGTSAGSPAPLDAGEMPDSYQLARERTLDLFERRYLDHIMRRAGGNITHAAQLAGKERRALGKLLKKHGVDRAEFVAATPRVN